MHVSLHDSEPHSQEHLGQPQLLEMLTAVLYHISSAGTLCTC